MVKKVKFNLVYILIFLVFTGVAISSCKDDTDKKIPVIEIINPFAGQSFNVPDTIHVEALISDDRALKSIQVGLVNKEFISVLPLVYLFPQNASYQLNIDYPVSSLDLETGQYYLFIRAEDEINFKNKYVSIYLTGLPKILEKIIVLTQKNPATIGVLSINPQNITEPLFEVAGDYASSETDSKNRQLYIAGITNFDIQAYNLDTKEMIWQRPAAPPLPVHSTDCFYFDEHLYASYASYFIYGYRYTGAMFFNTTLEENKIPSRIMVFNDFLLADLQSKTGGFTYIATYYLSTGVEKQRIQTYYKVVDFYDGGENKVVVVGNQNEEGIIYLLDPVMNKQTLIANVPGKIFCSVKLPDDDYLIGTQHSVFLFTINPLTLEEIFIGTTLFRLRFDPVNQQIYAAGNSEIFVFNYPEIEKQNAITISDGILNLHLYYNR
jgi:hypothetical protein